MRIRTANRNRRRMPEKLLDRLLNAYCAGSGAIVFFPVITPIRGQIPRRKPDEDALPC